MGAYPYDHSGHSRCVSGGLIGGMTGMYHVQGRLVGFHGVCRRVDRAIYLLVRRLIPPAQSEVGRKHMILLDAG